MQKKIIIFILLLALSFMFTAVSFGGVNLSGQISPSVLAKMPPGFLEKLTPAEIEQLKKSLPPQNNNKSSRKPVVSVANKPAEQHVNQISSAKKTQAVKKKAAVKKQFAISSKSGENLSIIERQYRNSYTSAMSSKLVQFGYDIFSSAKLKTSMLAVPGRNYLLGPGDKLFIRLWGSGTDASYPAVIDREGKIDIPKIGVIHLAGVKFGDAESIIKKTAEKYIQGINLNVALTNLRSLEIYIVGAVKNPGLHLVPAFSTIFDGLLAAGGVKKTGTLRRIKLFRENKIKQVFDLYNLLLKGNRNSDLMLQNRDVIFVPGIGHTAAVAGAVNDEGIFEINGSSNVNRIVSMAGGMLPQATEFHINLRRFNKNKEFIVYDLNKKTTKQWAKIPVKNGDLIEVGFSQSPLRNFIKITGHIYDADVFQFKPGMKLSDVLTSPDILKPDALTKFAIIQRYNKLTTLTTPVRFPLSKVFSGEYDAPLQSKDTIVILSRSAIGIKQNIVLSGAVWKPGQYTFTPGLKLKDALALAGGIKLEARTDKIRITRKIKTKEKFEAEYIEINLKEKPDFLLKPDDTVLIPALKNYTVNLSGNVWYPKTMEYHTGMKLSDILISKDLPKPEDILKPNAMMKFGLIYRYNSDTTLTSVIRFPVARVFQGTYDALLHPFDKVVVLSRQKLGIDEKYSISGAVWKTGDFSYHPGLRLKDAIALSGGIKFGARTDKIEIARQYIKGNKIETSYIVLNTKKDGDFLLKPYDSIMIPMIKDATFARKVRISGEVANPGTYTVKNGEKLSDLIQRAGGFTEFAYFYGAKYTSQQAKAIQQSSINKMINRLQLELIKLTSEQTQSAVSEQDLKAAAISGNQIQAFIKKLKAIQAEGRIAIHLADLGSFKNSAYDFILKPGDALNIPERPSFVSVVGSVYSPGSFLYQPNKKLKFYLSKSGGITKNADKNHIYLIKANGEIMSMSQNNGFLFFSKFKNVLLMPGDTIVAPENLDRIPYLKLIKDVSDIAFKIATTAGVAISLNL